MPWHDKAIDEVLTLLSSRREGLSAAEAHGRLAEHGYNELPHEHLLSPAVLFFRQFKNSLIIILLIATLLSALVGELADAALILAIVLFSASLGFIQEYRAERALTALRQMLAPLSRALRDGRVVEVPSRELVPGDVILLEGGDRVPADGRLLESYSLRCDEAPLTGESTPVGKGTTTVAGAAPPAELKNMVFTGTTVATGRGIAVVTATGQDTELGKIALHLSDVESEPTPLEKRTAEIGRWFGIIALGICFTVTAVSAVRQSLAGPAGVPFFVAMAMFAVSLAVAAVPEALSAIVTGALAIGMHRMAQRNALVRRMPAVETLGCVTVICTDKTGTLTRGEMTVRRIFAAGRSFEVAGSGYAPDGAIRDMTGGIDAREDETLRLMLRYGLLCSDAVLEQEEGRWGITGDPTEGALVVAAAKADIDQSETRRGSPRIDEIPFTPERKRMTTLHRMPDGVSVICMKGAAETVLVRCSTVMTDDGVVPLADEERRSILAVAEVMAADALRVLGVAFRYLPDEEAGLGEADEMEMAFLGLAGMMDPPREEAIEAIRVCAGVGIRPVMITGDHRVTAMAVAREMGIFRDGDLVLTGAELAAMAEEELAAVVERVAVYARVSPLDKLKIVRAWREKGEVVAMTGDGVNDAPALKHADIGVAMGLTGTDVARGAADMVLGDDNFATIVYAIEQGRWIYDNIKKYLTYLLRCNITEVAVIGGVALMLGPDRLPLLPAAILYINLATDGLPALALGIAPPEPDIMARPPRNPRESVFSRDVRALLFVPLLVEIPFFYLVFFYAPGDVQSARTRIFLLFIVTELVIALNFRSMRWSIFTHPPHGWLVAAVASQLLVTSILLPIPAVRDAFGVTAPSASNVAILIAFAVTVVVMMESIKAFLRRGARTRGL